MGNALGPVSLAGRRADAASHVTDTFADPDHPGRVCLLANVTRDVVLRAKDDRYAEWEWIRAATPEGERLLVGRATPRGR